MSEKYWKILGAVALVALGVLARVALRPFVPPGNALIMFDLFATVGVLSVLAGLLLGGVFSIVVPLGAMAGSDLILGNGMIFVFTWSGLAMMGVLGNYARNGRAPTAAFGLRLTGIGLAGILAFDLWTNFGWWALFYPHTAAGLAACFAMAVPFMVGHLLTTAVLLPAVGLGALYAVENRARLAARVRAGLGLPASA